MIRRIGWANDLHLNRASKGAVAAFFESVRASGVQALCLAGDTDTGHSIDAALFTIAGELNIPLYLVAGNHDFYGAGSVEMVRDALADLRQVDGRIVYLHRHGPALLGERTALLGVDGWGDMRYGDPSHTDVEINDFDWITDVKYARSGGHLLFKETLRSLGDESAHALRHQIEQAVGAGRTRLIVMTHVPPFPRASWHLGRESDAFWLPFMACKATGDVLLAAASSHPGVLVEVLCGHTHSGGVVRMRPNLVVKTGPAEYGKPCLQGVIEVA